MPDYLDLTLKFASPAIAIGALVVAIVGTRNALRVARLALSKADKEEKYELSGLLWKTKELRGKVEILDDYIFKKRFFTRRRDILDALTAIRSYWSESGAALAHHLGKENPTYLAFRGLYEVALENEGNQPPSDGHGEWRGITQQKLFGRTVFQVISHAIDELAKKSD